MASDSLTGSSIEQRGGELAELLEAAETDAAARDRLVTMLYPELRRIAASHMRRERPNHTLQATALVGEFFVHMAKTAAFTARSRAQFLMAASVVMRRLLVDHARSRTAEKRGGDAIRVEFDLAEPSGGARIVQILEIDELLSQLATSDERMARIVELRFFGGLTNAEIAEALGVHERTVKREWQIARAWLYNRLHSPHGHGG